MRKLCFRYTKDMTNFLLVRNRQEFLNQYPPSEREVVILIGGISRPYRSWLGFAEALSEKLDVICLDLPGVGLSKDAKLLYRVQDMAQEFMRVVHQLRLERVFIVASGLGATIALDMAYRLPIEVMRGLILMSPSHSGLGIKRVTRQGLRTLQKASASRSSQLSEVASELFIGRNELGLSLAEVNPQRLSQWKEIMQENSQELGKSGLFSHMVAAFAYTSRKSLEHVRHYQIPVKCLFPSDDRLIPMAHSRQVFEALKHPQAAVIELHNAGHDLIATHSAQVQDIVVNFVKDQSTYRVYTEIRNADPKDNPTYKEARRQAYATVGLFTFALVLFSWLLKREQH